MPGKSFKFPSTIIRCSTGPSICSITSRKPLLTFKAGSGAISSKYTGDVVATNLLRVPRSGWLPPAAGAMPVIAVNCSFRRSRSLAAIMKWSMLCIAVSAAVMGRVVASTGCGVCHIGVEQGFLQRGAGVFKSHGDMVAHQLHAALRIAFANGGQKLGVLIDELGVVFPQADLSTSDKAYARVEGFQAADKLIIARKRHQLNMELLVQCEDFIGVMYPVALLRAEPELFDFPDVFVLGAFAGQDKAAGLNHGAQLEELQQVIYFHRAEEKP